MTSSILDDAFYVLRTVLARILSTSSPAVVHDMVRSVRTTMEEDYCAVFVRRMEAVWRGASGLMTVDGPRKETATREMRVTFIVSARRYLEGLSFGCQANNLIMMLEGLPERSERLG